MRTLLILLSLVFLTGCDKVIETRTQKNNEFERERRCVLRTDMVWGTYLNWEGKLKTGYHPKKIYGVQNSLYGDFEKTYWYKSGKVETRQYEEIINKLEACREEL